MRSLSYARPAKRDLIDIANYTLHTWGANQADLYIEQLQTACERLQSTPFIGRECSGLHPGLRRIEHGSHVIFYLVLDRRIRIARFLHKKMLPESSDFTL